MRRKTIRRTTKKGKKYKKVNTFETILVTCVTLHVIHKGGNTFSQKYMSLALTVKEVICLGDFE